jgi:hypothetical protein
MPSRTSQTFSATLGLGPSCLTMKLLISLLSIAPLLFRSVILAGRSGQFAVCNAGNHSITTSGTPANGDEFVMNPGRISDVYRGFWRQPVMIRTCGHRALRSRSIECETPAGTVGSGGFLEAVPPLPILLGRHLLLVLSVLNVDVDPPIRVLFGEQLGPPERRR